MKQISYLISTFALLVLLLPAGAAFGYEETLKPTVRYQSVFPVANPPAQFEVVQFVEEFGYRAWLPGHSHSGPGFVTVLEGAVTVQSQEVKQTYQAGETFVEPAGVTVEIGNLAPERARLMLTFLVPKGAELTTQQDGRLSERTPVAKYQSSFEPAPLAGPFNLMQQVVDFGPGSSLPLDAQASQGFVTVLEGALRVQAQGVEKTYQAGETFAQTPGLVMAVNSPTPEKASIVITTLSPQHAEPALPSKMAVPARLPQTGGVNSPAPGVWLLLAGSGLIMSGWVIRRLPRYGRVKNS